jgi:hypothetical protein
VIKNDKDNRERPKQIETGLPLAVNKTGIKNSRVGLTRLADVRRKSFGVQSEEIS